MRDAKMMSKYHGDEHLNYISFDEEEKKMKSLSEYTLYDLSACEHYTILRKNEEDGYDLLIKNEDDEEIGGLGLHAYAADELAKFCRKYLKDYEKAQGENNE